LLRRRGSVAPEAKDIKIGIADLSLGCAHFGVEATAREQRRQILRLERLF